MTSHPKWLERPALSGPVAVPDTGPLGGTPAGFGATDAPTADLDPAGGRVDPPVEDILGTDGPAATGGTTGEPAFGTDLPGGSSFAAAADLGAPGVSNAPADGEVEAPTGAS